MHCHRAGYGAVRVEEHQEQRGEALKRSVPPAAARVSRRVLLQARQLEADPVPTAYDLPRRL